MTKSLNYLLLHTNLQDILILLVPSRKVQTTNWQLHSTSYVAQLYPPAM